jgi:hypothetical protein
MLSDSNPRGCIGASGTLAPPSSAGAVTSFELQAFVDAVDMKPKTAIIEVTEYSGNFIMSPFGSCSPQT